MKLTMSYDWHRRHALGSALVTGLLLSGCGSDTPFRGDAGVADIIPDGTVDTASADPDAAPVRGACTGVDDTLTMEQHSSVEFETALRTCVMPLVLAGAGPGTASFVEDATACFSESVGVSSPCARCHASSAECWFDGCGLTCMPAPEAVACTECRCGANGGTNCVAALDACTGVATGACG